MMMTGIVLMYYLVEHAMSLKEIEGKDLNDSILLIATSPIGLPILAGMLVGDFFRYVTTGPQKEKIK